jgi:DNA-directed RNA polymerase subunit RPC12/RpoP
MASFQEIMITDLTNPEKFTRKHLVNIYIKYNRIWKHFKINEYGGTRDILLSEVEDEIAKQRKNNKLIYESEAKEIVLQRNREFMGPFYKAIYKLHQALPLEENKTHYECQCGSKVIISNKSHHLKTIKHMNFVNKVESIPKELKESKALTTIDCGCGKSFSLKNKSHHNKTQYHLDWENLTKEETL